MRIDTYVVTSLMNMKGFLENIVSELEFREDIALLIQYENEKDAKNGDEWDEVG